MHKLSLPVSTIYSCSLFCNMSSWRK